MKKTAFCTILVLIILIMGAVSTAQSKKTILLVTDDTPGDPYIIGGGTAFQEGKPGLEIELYRMAARDLGINVTFKRIPWKQCLLQLENNKVDGIFPASYKEEREEFGVYPQSGGKVDPSRKTRDNGYFLYKMKGSKISWDGKKFSNADGTIAAPNGWAVVSDLKEMDLDIKEVPVHENSPDLLVKNRVAGFICLETVFDGYIAAHPDKYRDIVKSEIAIWEKPYYLLMSRKFVKENPDLAENFWNKVRDLKATDEYKKLLVKYSE